MPDIYIIDKDRKESETIKDICVDYTVSRNVDISVSAVSMPPENNCTAVYLLPLGDDTASLSQTIRSGSASYILIILDDPVQLYKAVTPMMAMSGFVIRPVSRDDLYRLLDCVFSDLTSITGGERMLSFRLKSHEYTVPYGKILYFEAENKKVLIRTASQEIECGLSLGNIEEMSPASFIRTHKSFVVNMDHITSVDYVNMEVVLSDGSAVYLSRSFKAQFKERFKEYHDSISVQSK
ncbi:MAG: LytTR family transcriptional regulator DNA-binding domain-containing protein [Ruminiclostridium sp.]|nr:LytTR family transcriptional regulator DNA-binding domain-containing protein [Ruminiclostridium sp.]